MSLQSKKEIERLVNDYLNVSSGDDWVVFHLTLDIKSIVPITCRVRWFIMLIG